MFYFQDLLNSESGGPSDSLSIMYGTLLRNFESTKDDYAVMRRRYDDLVAAHAAAVSKLELSQVGQELCRMLDTGIIIGLGSSV